MLRLIDLETPEIITPNLNLRPFTLDDVDPLFQILEVPGVLRYFPNPDPPERERIQKLIKRQIQHWQDHGYGWWAVDSRADRKLIGWSGLQNLPETDEIEIGYLLAEPYWGKGLATESAQVGLKFGFNKLELPEIIGIVHPENNPSQRVLEKIGLLFLQEAEYFGMKCYKYKIERTVPENNMEP